MALRLRSSTADHIIKWLAHRVQRPQDKINHALVLGGLQGIGKEAATSELSGVTNIRVWLGGA